MIAQKEAAITAEYLAKLMARLGLNPSARGYSVRGYDGVMGADIGNFGSIEFLLHTIKDGKVTMKCGNRHSKPISTVRLVNDDVAMADIKAGIQKALDARLKTLNKRVAYFTKLKAKYK